MPETKEPTSMYKTVEDHEKRITSLEERDEEREVRDRQHEQRLKTLEDNTLRMENTIMSENRETRNTFREQTKELFTIVEAAMGYQNTRSAQTHEFKILKWNTLSTVFLKVAGGLFALLSSGGLLYVVITSLLEK